MFNKLFAKKKDTAVSTNETINNMNDSLSLLQKRERLLNKKIEEEVAKAKEFIKKKNETAAKLCLKRKKAYEDQVNKLHNQMLNMETMSMKLEEASIDMETIKAQTKAASQLKKIHKELGGADKISEHLDNVRDIIEDANEISDALAQPLGADTLDDDDLLNELNELEQEEMDKDMLKMKPTPKTTTTKEVAKEAVAKVTSKHVVKEEEDDELAALEAEMHG